jgi:OOP family OmpA-OmpF porin
MKNTLIILGVVASQLVFSVKAQQSETFNKWSVGASLGVHDGQAPNSMYTRIHQIHHYGINARYMMNNRVGLMVDFGYDFMDGYGSGDRNVHYLRSSIQGVVNAGEILKFHTFSKRLGLLIHGGAGSSTMLVKKEYRDVPIPGDPNFTGVDKMMNFIFGARPQFKLTEKVSLNADLSFIFHHNQDYQFDMLNRNFNSAIDGYFLNLSVGASLYLGKAEKHLDWQYDDFDSELSMYEEKLKMLEDKMKDDDMDGVPNYLDAEPNSMSGAKVNARGVTEKPSDASLDSDGDGVPDMFDLCPNDKGTFGGSGCPDTDGDGVYDNVDKCKNEFGTAAMKGCPENDNGSDVFEIMNNSLKTINFQTGKFQLTEQSFKILDEVVGLMKKEPTYKLSIAGHTDNVGNADANVKLSNERAKTVKDYLLSQGIKSNRFIAIGFGSARPVATNNTPEGKFENRRVEFALVR